jgi:tRNA G18 (ribose-2'-O)-methylase SpoU
MVHRAEPIVAAAGVIAIDSLDDSRVADYRLIPTPALLAAAGLFVAEGRLTLERLIEQPRFRIRSVLLTPTARTALDPVLSGLDAAIPVYIVSRTAMSTLVGFEMHRGCLALAERPGPMHAVDLDLSRARRVLVLEGISNPDNVGGLFRSAAAFGVTAVLLGRDCGDPLYRKAIRTSMGGALQVPFAAARPWPQMLTTLAESGFRVVALTPANTARPLDQYARDVKRVALVLGAEGHGLSAEALAAIDEHVRIPMPGVADSLNVVVAASIALWHFSAPG